MKKETHPTYYKNAKVKCACGNIFTVGATVPELEVEICSNCHPFYTGKGKLVDTAGRVDKFKTRVLAKQKIAKTRGGKKTRKVKTAKRREARAKRIEEK